MEDMGILGVLFTMVILIVLAFIIANAGSKRNIGFGWALFLGLFFSPIVSLIAVLLSDKIQPDESGKIQKNWGCTGPIVIVSLMVVLLAVLVHYYRKAEEKIRIEDQIEKEQSVKF